MTIDFFCNLIDMYVFLVMVAELIKYYFPTWVREQFRIHGFDRFDLGGFT